MTGAGGPSGEATVPQCLSGLQQLSTLAAAWSPPHTQAVGLGQPGTPSSTPCAPRKPPTLHRQLVLLVRRGRCAAHDPHAQPRGARGLAPPRHTATAAFGAAIGFPQFDLATYRKRIRKSCK